MPSKKHFAIIFLCLLFLSTTALTSCRNRENPADAKEQEIQFYTGRQEKPVYSKSFLEKTDSRYVFAPALQGDIVRHDFILRNDEKKALEIVKAEGCCGAIIDSFTRVIPPGQEGKISLLILTDSRGGQEINGTIRAETSDPERPDITIDISLYVKEFAALHPYRLWLKGSPDEKIVEKSIVIPNEEYPFHITGIKTRKGVWFEYEWKEIEKDGKRAYEITVRNTRNKPGPYQDVLFVQTDHAARPEFKIRVEGRISESPPADPLPSGKY